MHNTLVHALGQGPQGPGTQKRRGPGPGTGPAPFLGPWPLGSLAQSMHKSVVHAQEISSVYTRDSFVYTQLCETMRNYTKLCGTMRNYAKLFETMQNYAKLCETNVTKEKLWFKYMKLPLLPPPHYPGSPPSQTQATAYKHSKFNRQFNKQFNPKTSTFSVSTVSYTYW